MSGVGRRKAIGKAGRHESHGESQLGWQGWQRWPWEWCLWGRRCGRRMQGQGSGQPARAVRLSYVDGQVKLAQGNQVLAEQAVANTPLFEGMQLTTADNGKAEIQFEDGSVARLVA